MEKIFLHFIFILAAACFLAFRLSDILNRNIILFRKAEVEALNLSLKLINGSKEKNKSFEIKILADKRLSRCYNNEKPIPKNLLNEQSIEITRNITVKLFDDNEEAGFKITRYKGELIIQYVQKPKLSFPNFFSKKPLNYVWKENINNIGMYTFSEQGMEKQLHLVPKLPSVS